MGFTDHDRSLEFDAILFRADTGMTSRSFQQSTGLSVDNTEALGALSDDSIDATDIQAGRFDAAAVTMWLVNWTNPLERSIRLSGTIGEIVCLGEGFRAELRGLTEALNAPQGKVFQRSCSAVLGDDRCRADVHGPRFRIELPIDRIHDGKTLEFSVFPEFENGWFERGLLRVLDGAAAGLTGHVKIDLNADLRRRIVLWQSIRADLKAGDRIQLVAGCDKLPDTCKAKFSNFVNFRGFPSIPGEDWLMAYPSDRVPNDGGKL